MLRYLAACLVLLCLAGCQVAPAVVWTTVGAGLGFGTAALTFDTELLKVIETDKAAPAVPGTR